MWLFRDIVSTLLLISLMGAHLAGWHLIREELCTIHKNCCCPNGRCTCSHDAAFSLDECAMSEWECDAIPAAGLRHALTTTLVDPPAMCTLHVIVAVRWPPVGLMPSFCLPSDIFHPPPG